MALGLATDNLVEAGTTATAVSIRKTRATLAHLRDKTSLALMDRFGLLLLDYLGVD